METTVKEIAEKHGVPNPIANGLVKFLEAKGLIKNVGKRKTSAGKGRSAIVYEIPDSIKLEL